MKQYIKILEDILEYGSIKTAARENMPNTKSIFDREIRITDGSLPILMGKKVLTRNVISELVWFLRGYTNIKFLHEYNNHIWDQDAYRHYLEKGGMMSFEDWLEKVNNDTIERYGDCGRIYGYQWRNQGKDNFESSIVNFERRKPIDQIKNLLNGLINEPFSRYHIVDAWNWQDTKTMRQALPACHNFFQCNVRETSKGVYKLDLSIWQRSCDMFLGVPYNLLSYGILHRLLCRITNYQVGVFTWHGGDCHIYENQVEAVNKYLDRLKHIKLPENTAQCIIDNVPFDDVVEPIEIIDNLSPYHISISNYNPLSFIGAPLSTGLKKE